MYNYQAKDGTIITDIPDEVPKNDPRLRARYEQMKSQGVKRDSYAGVSPGAMDPSTVPARGAMPAQAQVQQPLSVPQGIARGIGQGTAASIRGVAGGVANTIGTVVDPATAVINTILDAVGAPPEIRGQTLGSATKSLLDMIGVPESETMAAKIVESASRGLGGAATGIGVGQAIPGAVGTALASGPVQQAMGGVGSEVASQVAGEMGANPLVQAGAGLAGGVAGSTIGNVANLRPGAVNPMQGVVDDATRFRTQPMTSDIFPPKTFAGKTGQSLAEKIPIAGTGPARATQQANRIEDMRDTLRRFGAYDSADASNEVMADLLNKKDLNRSRWMGMKNKVIDDLSFKNIADDDGNKILSTDDIMKMQDEGIRDLYVRWSRGPKYDTKPSRDYASGNTHSGLSAVPIDYWEKDIMNRRLKEYEFLRMKDQNLKPYIYRASEIAKDSDGYSSIPVDSVPIGVWNENKNLTRIVPMPTATKKIDDSIAFLKSLKNPSLWDPYIKELEGFKGSIDGQDLRNVEIGRATIGDIFNASDNDSVKRMGKKLVTGTKTEPGIYDAVNEDMGNYIKKAGSEAEYNKWKIANKELSKMMDELDLDILKNTLEKGVDRPEVVKNMIRSKDRSVLESLNRNLSTKGREAAKTAIMQDVANKVGDSPDKFVSEMERMAKSGDPVGVFFKVDDLNVIKGLTRVLKVTERASKAALNPPTGVQAVIPLSLIGMGGGSVALEKYFGQGLTGLLGSAALIGTAGGAARIYESPAVRNVLMKFPKVAANSVEETALFNRLFEVIKAQESKETQ